jgi:hypothetical protein
MVKYETFNLCYMGSNPIGLKKYNYKDIFFNILINGDTQHLQNVSIIY